MIDLNVPLFRPVAIERLLWAGGSALRELLGVGSTPELTMGALDSNRAWRPLLPTERFLWSDDSPMYLVGMLGVEENIVGIVVGEVGEPSDDGYEDDIEEGIEQEELEEDHDSEFDRSGWYPGPEAVVTAATWSLGYALTAAVALALAREVESVIMDYQEFWIGDEDGERLEYDPETFARTLAVRHWQPDATPPEREDSHVAVAARRNFPDLMAAAATFQANLYEYRQRRKAPRIAQL